MENNITRKTALTEDRAGKKYRVSVVIPNRNGAETIGHCLDALFASNHDSFEVVVVDDCSEDNSALIIKEFPCKLVKLTSHGGAAAARNRGADICQGEIIFFTDADCLVLPDTLHIAEEAANRQGPRVILGGTYTCTPFDRSFFSLFQSVFINYSELKKPDLPDYIATHAMAIHTSTFKDSGGFKEDFLPILEDVEFSHRLRREGYRLRMADRLLVKHVFNYTLGKSLRNAYAKSRFWVIYSLFNRDLFKDSGTASFELKTNVLLFHVLLLLFFALLKFPTVIPPASLLIVLFINFMINYRLMNMFRRTGGPLFGVLATAYYMVVYPLAVGIGAFSGFLNKQKLSFETNPPGNR
jgi:glycosyltransferase involved in cell wall biosynthesis